MKISSIAHDPVTSSEILKIGKVVSTAFTHVTKGSGLLLLDFQTISEHCSAFCRATLNFIKATPNFCVKATQPFCSIIVCLRY